jgi:hypothetical protein
MPNQFDLNEWLRLLDQHIARWPLAHVEDLYKWVFQAIRGPEHLIQDRSAFLARLEAEFQATEADRSHVLWEPLRPDHQLGRLHLAAFKATSMPIDALGEACLSSAQQAWGSREELETVWQQLEAKGIGGRWPSIEAANVERFGELIANQGFGAIHHSERFRQHYRPAYRLVSQQALGLLLKQQ